MKLKLILLCAAVLSLGAVGAYAAIPNSTNGSITACVDSHGALKVIDAEAGQTCGSGKKTVTFTHGVPWGAVHTSYGETAQSTASFKYKVVNCPAGSVATGGGANIVGAGNEAPIALTRSLPMLDNAGWYVTATAMAPVSESWKLIVFATCIDESY